MGGGSLLTSAVGMTGGSLPSHIDIEPREDRLALLPFFIAGSAEVPTAAGAGMTGAGTASTAVASTAGFGTAAGGFNPIEVNVLEPLRPEPLRATPFQTETPPTRTSTSLTPMEERRTLRL